MHDPATGGVCACGPDRANRSAGHLNLRGAATYQLSNLRRPANPIQGNTTKRTVLTFQHPIASVSAQGYAQFSWFQHEHVSLPIVFKV
jgi:hypothetical protein